MIQCAVNFEDKRTHWQPASPAARRAHLTASARDGARARHDLSPGPPGSPAAGPGRGPARGPPGPGPLSPSRHRDSKSDPGDSRRAAALRHPWLALWPDSDHETPIAKVGLSTKPASWILVWLRAHGSFPGFVLETPRRGRQKRKARSLGFCILYKVIRWPGFVLSPTFWRKQSTMSGFVHLINGKRGV